MRASFFRNVVLAGGIVALTSAPGFAAESPEDFAHGLPIEITAGEALHRVALPATVYESSVYSDLRDMRVFNAAGEVVPHAFRPVERIVQQPIPVLLPMYSLRGPADANADDLELSFEKTAGQVSVRLKSSDAKPARPVLLGYLIDLGAMRSPLAGVQVDWRTSVDRLSFVRIEASDDLRTWRTLVADAPLGSLGQSGQRLERKAIEFRTHRENYLRLMWSDPSQAIELKSVAGLFPEATVQPQRDWKEVTATVADDKRGEFVFDLGGHFPLDRLEFRLPAENTVAPVTLYSRDKPEEKWSLVASTVVYRLNQEGRELLSPPIAVEGRSYRHWMVSVHPSSGGVGARTLSIRAGWTPRELVFAARGPGPFLLTYGSAGMTPGALAIDTLVPGWRTDQEMKTAVATTGTPRAIAGESARSRIDLKKWALWAALFTGVAVLAFMAWKLTRQINQPGSNERK
ncbi:MAG: DUF3999 domain-containing protein [Burkholderiales bacterium]